MLFILVEKHFQVIKIKYFICVKWTSLAHLKDKNNILYIIHTSLIIHCWIHMNIKDFNVLLTSIITVLYFEMNHILKQSLTFRFYLDKYKNCIFSFICIIRGILSYLWSFEYMDINLCVYLYFLLYSQFY